MCESFFRTPLLVLLVLYWKGSHLSSFRLFASRCCRQDVCESFLRTLLLVLRVLGMAGSLRLSEFWLYGVRLCRKRVDKLLDSETITRTRPSSPPAYHVLKDPNVMFLLLDLK